MTPMELIFSMLGEEATRQIAIKDDAIGFLENRAAALEGGRIAGDAREKVEKTGRVKVVSSENYLKQIEEAQKKDEHLLDE